MSKLSMIVVLSILLIVDVSLDVRRRHRIEESDDHNKQLVTNDSGGNRSEGDTIYNTSSLLSQLAIKRVRSIPSMMRSQLPRVLQHSNNHRTMTTSACRCEKRAFFVNLFDLGWGEYFVHPKTFNAYRCVGDCSLPSMGRYYYRAAHNGKRRRHGRGGGDDLGVAIKVTNHAQVMSILEYKHPELLNANESKCVSTRYRPLFAVFLDERGRMRAKRYEDMIVEECGCR